MKKLAVTLATTVLCVGLTTGTALADSISNTGPGSDNTIVNEQDEECIVENNNNVDVSNDSSQTSNSGNAGNQNNTSSGDATSGDAGNQNNAQVDVDITNAGCQQEEEREPVPVQPTVQPGGRGSGVVKAAKAAEEVVSLPVTGTRTSELALAAVALASGGLTWTVVRRLVN